MTQRFSDVMKGSVLFSAAAASAANVMTLDVSTITPANASVKISPSFAGFGIEPSNLFAYTSGADSNNISVNLLSNLADYAGKPPYIRLGGNTQDYMIYDESHDGWNIKLNRSGSLSEHMIIGPRYFEAMNLFPAGTPVTWGLNLAYNGSDHIDRIVTMAQQVFDRCKNLDIQTFEIGNEPDLYHRNGFRSRNWDGKDYTEEWLDRASAVWEKVLKPLDRKSNVFDAPATTAWVGGTTFEIEKLIGYGITSKANGGSDSYISAWNQHDYFYFLNNTDGPLTLDRIGQLSQTELQLMEALGLQLSQAKNTGYPVVLREMGVVGPLGLAGTSDTFTSALWTLNFLLYAATVNIESVQFHMTENSFLSAWKVIKGKNPKLIVRPHYYGLAAFDQAVGSACETRIAALTLSGVPGYENYARAYGVYQGKALDSVVVVNAKQANVSDSQKSNLSIQVSLPKTLAGKTAYLAYLTNDGADATNGTTWNGISFEKSGDGTPTTVDDASQSTVTVADDGSLSFNVRDSQAVVVSLYGKVGSESKTDTAACTTVSAGIRATGASESYGSESGDDGSSSATASTSTCIGLFTYTTFFSLWIIAVATGFWI